MMRPLAFQHGSLVEIVLPPGVGIDVQGRARARIDTDAAERFAHDIERVITEIRMAERALARAVRTSGEVA